MRTVAFYSYKGGVGRTLLLANAARFLALAGKKVVALDLDLEAPGLHYKLGAPDVLAHASAGTLRGAVDELLAVLSGAGGSPITDFAVAIDLPSDCRGSLHLIPAGSAPSTQYWSALATLTGETRREDAGGGLAEAVLDLQARIADELAPDFLLVDARTGITELGGLATTIVADRVVCLTTTSPESIEGTLLVANAVRAAPRLPGQADIEIEFLLTRVDMDGPSGPSTAGGSKLTYAAILPHDRAIANKERVLGGERTHDRRASLFAASLAWIAKSFPGLAEEAEIARTRMVAVDSGWRELTGQLSSIYSDVADRRHWPANRLRGGVRFRADSNSGVERFADIVAYDRPASDPDAKPVLVVEYATHDVDALVAQWWMRADDFAIVCLLGKEPLAHRLFARDLGNRGARLSERRDLPMPYDFDALHDPTDVSIDALIDAVRRGHSEYVSRLVTEWILAVDVASGVRMPRDSETACQIVDGLASISDVPTSSQILREITSVLYNFATSGTDDYISIDEQVHQDLFTPLWWRFPLETSIAFTEGLRSFDRSRHFPVKVLAERFLGLRYDPDAETRRLEALALRRDPVAITFERRSGDPPIALHTESTHNKKDASEAVIGDLTLHLIQKRVVVFTGFLGDYEPEHGCVVLYSTAINATAAKLEIPPRSLATITLLHGTVLALAHLGRDLDDRRWYAFAPRPAGSPSSETSMAHTVIAQCFAYKFLEHLADQSLLAAFERLTDYQPPAYHEWRRLKDRTLEDLRGWLMSLRGGVVPPGFTPS